MGKTSGVFFFPIFEGVICRGGGGGNFSKVGGGVREFLVQWTVK